MSDTKSKYKSAESLSCSLCRRSYTKGRNHIYSSNHIESVRKALAKFSQKIQEARSCLNNPVLKSEDLGDRRSAHFWCYFCSKEIPKHFVFDKQLYLENAGLLEHISSTRHMLKAKVFWRNNRIRAKTTVKNQKAPEVSKLGFANEHKSSQRILQDYYKDIRNNSSSGVNPSISWKEFLKQYQSKKAVDINLQSAVVNSDDESEKATAQSVSHSSPLTWSMDLFILPELDFNRFKTNCKQCIDQYFAERDKQLNQDANFIANCSKKRAHMMEFFQKQMSRTTEFGVHHGGQKPRQQGASKTVSSVRTVSAFGEGLTCIGIPKVDESVGNVYTDTLPPWLQESGENTESRLVIGPTADDLNKHLERQKKLKLPATRVGVNYNHQAATGIDDLPSFGGVWSKNRRSHQQAGFKRTLQRGRGRDSRLTASAASTVRGTSVVSDNRGENRLQLPLHRVPQPCSDPTGLRSASNARTGGYQRKRSVTPQDVRNNDLDGLRLNVASNLL